MSQAAEGGRAAGRPEPSSRPKLTSRVAVLAVLICAIALTLAYPIRAYLAERRQVAQLEAQDAQLAARERQLAARQRALTSPSYIEQQARDQLHLCFPTQTCYVVIDPVRPHAKVTQAEPTTPWYGELWKSVKEADKVTQR